MPYRLPPPDSPAPPPPFDPVPVRARRDGWMPERQRAFIAALASGLCVDRAAAAAGLSRESAYRLRRHPKAGSFAAAWDKAVAARPRPGPNPAALWHRAFYGKLKPIVRGGRVVAVLHQADNQALLSLARRQERSASSSARMRARLDRGGSSQ